MTRQTTHGSSSSSTISGSRLTAPSRASAYGRSPSPRRAFSTVSEAGDGRDYAPSSSNGSEAFADPKRSSVVSISSLRTSPRLEVDTETTRHRVRASISRANMRRAEEDAESPMTRTLSAASARRQSLRRSPERAQTSAGHYDSPTRSTLTESGRQRFLEEYGDRPYSTVGRTRDHTASSVSPRKSGRPSLPSEWMQPSQPGLSPQTNTFARAYTPESSGRPRADSTSTRRSGQYDSPSSLEARRRKTSTISDRSDGASRRIGSSDASSPSPAPWSTASTLTELHAFDRRLAHSVECVACA